MIEQLRKWTNQDATTASETAARSYLAKPFSRRILLDTVIQALSSH